MKSKVTLYYHSLVNKDKNFVLDNSSGESKIDTYLSTLTSETITEFQYVKHQKFLSIKIHKNQVALEMVNSKDLNYVKIQNYDVVNNAEVLERAYYYFVENKNWRAKDTIEIMLKMDTLNTFRYNVDYVIDPKTLTKRMHKDRFEKTGLITRFYLEYEEIPSGVETIGGQRFLFEDDWWPLGTDLDEHYANMFRQYGGMTAKVTRVYDDDDNRYLWPWEFSNYGAEFDFSLDDDNNVYITWKIPIYTNYPTHTYLFSIDVYGPDNEIIRKIDLKSEDISCPVYKKNEEILQETNFLIEWALYYRNRTDQENSPVDCYLTASQPLKFKTPSATNLINANDLPSGKIILISPTYQGQLSFKIGNEVFTIKENRWQDTFDSGVAYNCIGFENDSGALKVYKLYFDRDDSESTIHYNSARTAVISGAVVEFLGTEASIAGYETTTITDYPDEQFPTPNFTLSFSGDVTITLATKDTIDKTLGENLKIINVPYCPSNITFDGDIAVFPSLWTYDSTYKFLRLTDLNARFNHYITTQARSILADFPFDYEINYAKKRYIIDSKLYHSDYYRPKFVYDSFTRNFSLEQIDYVESIKETSAEKFEFTFVMSRNIVSKFLFKFNFVYKYALEDYPNIVAVARNNEEVLYNSSYLNYIRTGYNYDLKAKERQEVASGVTIGLSALGLVASGVAGAVTGNPIAIGSAIASGISLASSLVNYAKSTAQNEENIQRKLQETQRQSISVLNADDYDLLYEYTTNKAKLCTYEVSDKMKSVLDDLFYYCGYVVNEQMVPVTRNRFWFNFVQATLVLKETSNLTTEIEDDIKERFEQGVTFLHYYTSTFMFDFKQEMENWEISLI